MPSSLRLVVLLALCLVLTLPVSAQDDATVFGQPDVTSKQIGHSATGMNFPLGITVDSSGGFYIAESHCFKFRRAPHRRLRFRHRRSHRRERVAQIIA